MVSLAIISASAEFKILTDALSAFIESGEQEENVRVACTAFVIKARAGSWPTYMLIKSLNDSSCYPDSEAHAGNRVHRLRYSSVLDMILYQYFSNA
jgi:hypothetical protein